MSQRSDYGRYRDIVGNSFATWYEDKRDAWTGAPTNDRVTEFVLRSAPPGGCDRRQVLDIGCGRGHQAVQFAEKLDAHVVGLDLLDVWDAPAPTRGTVEPRIGDFLDFRRDGLDLLVDNGCLHHQRHDEWLPWVAHGSELLRPGGVWVVSIFLSPTDIVMERPLPDGRINWWLTDIALIDLLAQVGLTPTDRLEIDREYVTNDGYHLSYLAVAFVKG